METFNTTGLKALFSYPFRQTNWQSKLLILGLLSAAGMIIPIVPWLFVWGYFAEIMRRQALEGGEPLLPEWENWSRLAMDGLRIGVVSLVMSLPMLLISFFGIFIYVLSFIPLMASEGESVLAMGLPFLSMIVWMILIMVSMVLSVVIGVVSPALMTHTAVKRSFAAALEVREWWGVLRANLGGYIIALVLVYVAFYICWMTGYMLIFTVICCALGPVIVFATTPYLVVIAGSAFGQVYREGQLKRAETAETPEAPDQPDIEALHIGE